MKINSCIFGFGSVAAQNIYDPVMFKSYRYSSHLQAVKKKKEMNVSLIIEKTKKSRLKAKKMVPDACVTQSVYLEKKRASEIEFLIITTPPNERLGIIENFPNVHYLIVEKPLGLDLKKSLRFSKEIKQRKIFCLVNYWRRYVKQFLHLKNGELKKILGNIKSIIIFYGNGIRNNGIHMIDFIRFLFGDISKIKYNHSDVCKESPIKNDFNIDFSGFVADIPFKCIPLDFKYFRENGFKFIGEKGVLSIVNDSRTMFYNKVRKNRGISNYMEVDYSKNYYVNVDYDLAMLNMYREILKMKTNSSSIENAIINERIIQSLIEKI